jgi:hypothetical protein
MLMPNIRGEGVHHNLVQYLHTQLLHTQFLRILFLCSVGDVKTVDFALSILKHCICITEQWITWKRG